MATNMKPASQASQHFWNICGENNISSSDVQRHLRRCLNEGKLKENEHRNINRFICGKGRKIGPTVRDKFLAFCRNELEIDIADEEFDINDRVKDFVGNFAQDNAYRCGLLSGITGEYRLFRPRTHSGKIQKMAPKDLLSLSLTVRPEGATGRYAFEYRTGSGSMDRRWAGYALCSDLYIYLVGFDQQHRSNVMLMVLTPLEQNRRLDGVLVGTETMRLDYSDSSGRHESVVSRVVAMGRVGAHQAKFERKAKDWLMARQAKDLTGATVSLRDLPLMPDEGSER